MRDAAKVEVVCRIVPEFKILCYGVGASGGGITVVVIVRVVVPFGDVQRLDVCSDGTRERVVVVVTPCGADERRCEFVW